MFYRLPVNTSFVEQARLNAGAAFMRFVFGAGVWTRSGGAQRREDGADFGRIGDDGMLFRRV